MKRIGLLLTICTLFLISPAFAQRSIADSAINIFMFTPSVAFQIPGGDLAQDFGDNFNLGGSLVYKTKSNWMIGLEGFFIFGDDVRQNVLAGMSTNEGYIISTAGAYSDIRLYERGYHFDVKVGKIIPAWNPPNKNSGVMLTGAVGFLQHKIRIEDADDDTPQLDGAYAQGYSRRTNGIAFTEFAGYQYLSNKNRINFFVGFEFVQAFTQNRLTYNFDTMGPINAHRFDTLNGIRAGWIVTFYKRKPKKVYYN